MSLNGSSTEYGSKPQSEGLRKRANRLFNYQQSHKVELPIPPTPTRKTKSSNIVDANRKLSSYGFTKKPKTDVGQNEGSQMVIDSQDVCLKDQTEQLNAEIAENLMSFFFFEFSPSNRLYLLRSLPYKTKIMQNNLCCTGIRIFNNLPSKIKEITQLGTFKQAVKSYLLDHVEDLLHNDDFLLK